jgi:hypothetical protein
MMRSVFALLRSHRQLDNKLLTNPRFLETVRKLALTHRDDAIPEKSGEYYQPMMWSKGVVDALRSYGYDIVKKESNGNSNKL